MGVDLTLVLVGWEETDQPSRDHIAQVTENATRLIHLRQADKGPMEQPLQPPQGCLSLGHQAKDRDWQREDGLGEDDGQVGAPGMGGAALLPTGEAR